VAAAGVRRLHARTELPAAAPGAAPDCYRKDPCACLRALQASPFRPAASARLRAPSAAGLTLGRGPVAGAVLPAPARGAAVPGRAAAAVPRRAAAAVPGAAARAGVQRGAGLGPAAAAGAAAAAGRRAAAAAGARAHQLQPARRPVGQAVSGAARAACPAAAGRAASGHSQHSCRELPGATCFMCCLLIAQAACTCGLTACARGRWPASEAAWGITCQPFS